MCCFRLSQVHPVQRPAGNLGGHLDCCPGSPGHRRRVRDPRGRAVHDELRLLLPRRGRGVRGRGDGEGEDGEPGGMEEDHRPVG